MQLRIFKVKTLLNNAFKATPDSLKIFEENYKHDINDGKFSLMVVFYGAMCVLIINIVRIHSLSTFQTLGDVFVNQVSNHML